MKFYNIIIPIFLLFCSCNGIDTKNSELDKISEEEYRDLRFDYFSDYPYTSRQELIDTIKSSSSIVGYNWNGTEPNPNKPHYIASEEGVLDPTIEEGLQLSQNQIDTLIQIFSDTMNFDNESQTCFVPHLSLVMYNETKVIGQVNVCFFCSGIKSIPRFEKSFSKTGFNKMEILCESIGLNVVKN